MRSSPPEFLSLAAWHTVRLLTEESSISVCIACKSSEAEITPGTAEPAGIQGTPDTGAN